MVEPLESGYHCLVVILLLALAIVAVTCGAGALASASAAASGPPRTRAKAGGELRSSYRARADGPVEVYLDYSQLDGWQDPLWLARAGQPSGAGPTLAMARLSVHAEYAALRPLAEASPQPIVDACRPARPRTDTSA